MRKFSEKEFKLLCDHKIPEDSLQELCEEHLIRKNIPFIHLKKWVFCCHCKKFHAVSEDKGYPDLDIKTRSGNIFIELKSKDGRLSDAQKGFRDNIVKLGYKFYVVRTYEQFLKIISLHDTST